MEVGSMIIATLVGSIVVGVLFVLLGGEWVKVLKEDQDWLIEKHLILIGIKYSGEFHPLSVTLIISLVIKRVKINPRR